MWQLLKFKITLFALAISFSAWAQEYVPGEIIVKLKGKSSGSAASEFFGKMQGKISLKTSFGAMNLHKVSIDTQSKITNIQDAIKEIQKDPNVEYAEPNYILHIVQDSNSVSSSDGSVSAANSNSTSNSESSSASNSSNEVLSQSQVDEMMQNGDTFIQNYANVGVEQAWPMMRTLADYSEKPIVAVIDTGVDYNHNIFRNSSAMWRNAGEIADNGVDDDGNGYIDDIYGWNFNGRTNNPMDDGSHGTHVAGIILGVGQDIFPSTWEPAKIRIMALKFLDSTGSGSTSDAIAAVYYAVNNGAQVINNSWGGASYSQSLHDALTYAYNRRVFIASAAGNSAKNNDSNDMFPANYPVPGQITVAATSDSDNLASFSNYGASTVQVAAPGVSVLSSVPGNNYRYMSGTSMATPFVSGLAALILREAPALTGYQIKNLILSSASSFSNLSSRVSSSGRVDVYDAISMARSQYSTAAYQPSYKAESRSIASSTEETSTTPKGCGTISSMMAAKSMNADGGEGGGDQTGLWLGAILLAPVLAWQVLRQKSKKKNRRAHDRFLMNSSLKLSVNGQDLVGHMRTISEGGLSFEAESLIAKGGIINMSIQSPDGQEMIQVQGRVVWSADNKSYGVQFNESKESVVDSIRSWTQKLVKVAEY